MPPVGADDAAALRAALARPRAASIAEVVACLRAIEDSLPREDGIAAFTHLYLAVTEAVADEAPRGGFRDPAFLEVFDVAFAELYFDALRAFIDEPARVPRAWAPLVESRGRSGLVPLQFALAGMNAHINRDLPVALVAICEEQGREPRDGSDEHHDFLTVNTILATTEARVKPELLTGFLGLLDRWLGAADDVVALWNVARARDAGWSNARTLWALRAAPTLADGFVRTLDRSTGMAGRGLLRPLPPVRRLVLDRLRRRFR
jgi:Family of unknown function (DUF5995)